MFACLFVADFPVQAVLLAEPENQNLWRSPVVVLDGPSNLPKVASLNDPARGVGIKIGMTQLEVEISDGVCIRKRSKEIESSAQAALLDCASSFSPRIESTSPGIVLLDLTGTQKLFGSPHNTACKIAVRTKQIGFRTRIAIASNPDTAFLAAKGFRSITIIPHGDEAKTLSSLHVNILPMPEKLARTLSHWGIRTFKALAALPTLELIKRLGQEGLKLQQLAQGRVKRPLLPVEQPPEFIASYEFDEPVDTIESIAFVLNRLLQQVFESLVSRSLATNEVRLTLDLEVWQIVNERSGEKYTHAWKLPVPTQDKNILLNLMRLDLERNTFAAPIKQVTIEAIPIRPRMAQGNLFAPPSPEPDQLEITLSRIRGLVGTADSNGVLTVGAGVISDTHKPGSFTVQQFSTDIKPPDKVLPRPAYALQAFRPEIATCVESTGEEPHLVQLYKKYRLVLKSSGPWCSSGSWWNKEVWSRAEWDVALKTFEGVGYYRIYLDRISKQWFIDGFYE